MAKKKTPGWMILTPLAALGALAFGWMIHKK
jgi:hypothetical protein